MINIVIPMAGEGSRFVKEGFTTPKPFIDVAGKPMIVRVMNNLSAVDAQFILVGREKHFELEKELVAKIKNEYNVIFIEINKLTEGIACTVLFARKYINNNDPLLIANSDQIVDIDINKFVNNLHIRELDGLILTFKDKFRNPKWSFAKIDKNGYVIEVKEKQPISEYATVGIYLYKRGKDFVDAAIDMIVENDRVNNEFYSCPTYNYAIRNQLKIGIYNIELDQMHGLGTPEDLKKYLQNIK